MLEITVEDFRYIVNQKECLAWIRNELGDVYTNTLRIFDDGYVEAEIYLHDFNGMLLFLPGDDDICMINHNWKPKLPFPGVFSNEFNSVDELEEYMLTHP